MAANDIPQKQDKPIMNQITDNSVEWFNHGNDQILNIDSRNGQKKKMSSQITYFDILINGALDEAATARRINNEIYFLNKKHKLKPFKRSIAMSPQNTKNDSNSEIEIDIK